MEPSQDNGQHPQPQGYSRTAVLMHWLLAVSIFFLFASSWWMRAVAQYPWRPCITSKY